MNEDTKISVTSKKILKKYHPGADPKKDEPFEILETTETLIGQQAIDFINSLANDRYIVRHPHKGGQV